MPKCSNNIIILQTSAIHIYFHASVVITLLLLKCIIYYTNCTSQSADHAGRQAVIPKQDREGARNEETTKQSNFTQKIQVLHEGFQFATKLMEMFHLEFMWGGLGG